MLYLGLVMTAFGYGIWYHVLAKHPVGQVVPVLLTLPLFSVLGSVLLLGERPGSLGAAGRCGGRPGVAMIVLKPEPIDRRS